MATTARPLNNLFNSTGEFDLFVSPCKSAGSLPSVQSASSMSSPQKLFRPPVPVTDTGTGTGGRNSLYV